MITSKDIDNTYKDKKAIGYLMDNGLFGDFSNYSDKKDLWLVKGRFYVQHDGNGKLFIPYTDSQISIADLINGEYDYSEAGGESSWASDI